MKSGAVSPDRSTWRRGSLIGAWRDPSRPRPNSRATTEKIFGQVREVICEKYSSSALAPEILTM